jgi:hypothetical protein
MFLFLSVLSFGVIGCSGASRSGEAETLTVNEALTGDRIRIVEFQNTSSASMQVSRKSSSAGSSPFFYQKGNIMVVHLGNDSRVEDALEAVLGPKEQ